MIFDVELHCDKWMDCKTKWCNGDGGFWCNEKCKLKKKKKKWEGKKGEKILSHGEEVDVLYAVGFWKKKKKNE